jgi:hypothetical protein
MPAFDHGEPAPAHILRETSFPIALGSPLGLTLSAVIAPSTALWEKGCKTYSLFLNGLWDYNTAISGCQAVADIFLSTAHIIAVLPGLHGRWPVQDQDGPQRLPGFHK